MTHKTSNTCMIMFWWVSYYLRIQTIMDSYCEKCDVNIQGNTSIDIVIMGNT
jgi:hypothetical protein